MSTRCGTTGQPEPPTSASRVRGRAALARREYVAFVVGLLSARTARALNSRGSGPHIGLWPTGRTVDALPAPGNGPATCGRPKARVIPTGLRPRRPLAPVVKWISHRPPEPGVEVRFLSGALRGAPPTTACFLGIPLFNSGILATT